LYSFGQGGDLVFLGGNFLSGWADALFTCLWTVGQVCAGMECVWMPWVDFFFWMSYSLPKSILNNELGIEVEIIIEMACALVMIATQSPGRRKGLG